MDFIKIDLKGRTEKGAIITGTYISSDEKWVVQKMKTDFGYDIGIRYAILKRNKSLEELNWHFITSSTIKNVCNYINETYYRGC